jgi:type II protein arginine methyltransferase
MEPLMAEAARENIRKNGFAEKITVIAKKSTDLVVGEDVPEPADLLVSQLLDNRLIGDGVLRIMEDAKGRLVKANGPTIPSRIAMRGVLAGGPEWTRKERLGEVLGLDLSALNYLLSPMYAHKTDSWNLDAALSRVMDIVYFDFARDDRFPLGRKVIPVSVDRSGVVGGVVQWIWFDLGGGLEFENKPPGWSRCPRSSTYSPTRYRSKPETFFLWGRSPSTTRLPSTRYERTVVPMKGVGHDV